MTDTRIPGRLTEEEGAAWLHGRADAVRAHIYSETFNAPFETDGTAVDMPAMYISGTEGERDAYADGYSLRAQDLADGSDPVPEGGE